MHAWDLTITAPSRPGTLATIGEEFGKAGVNIEGMCAFEHKGQGFLHLVVTDRDGARKVVEKFNKVGFEVDGEREVIVEHIDNRPGALGEHCRRIAEQDVNLTTAYMATDTRLVLGADDLTRLEQAWRVAAGAARS